MALKTKIRSMRFSEEMEQLINEQVGETFSAKFERLVYNCYMLAPQKEKEIQELDKKIARKKELIKCLQDNYRELSSMARSISGYLSSIDSLCDRYYGLTDSDFGPDDSEDIRDSSLRM